MTLTVSLRMQVYHRTGESNNCYTYNLVVQLRHDETTCYRLSKGNKPFIAIDHYGSNR